MAIRFVSKATVKNKLVRSSNVWDGTAVYNPFTLVGNYDALATVTVPATAVSSITFSGIPTTGYSHLQIRAAIFSNANQSDVRVQFNGDTATNYSNHGLYGSGASATANGNANTTFAYGGLTGDTTRCGVTIIDILDYANTNKNKTLRNISGVDQNGSGYVELQSGNWRNTAAITSITIFTNAANYTQYSSFALYGVK
jgi:hypothetical protein